MNLMSFRNPVRIDVTFRVLLCQVYEMFSVTVPSPSFFVCVFRDEDTASVRLVTFPKSHQGLVEHLSSKCKVLSANPSTTKQQQEVK
jgi:hypothetical protein